MKEIIIISLGGSIVIPNEINVTFLKNLRKLITKYTSKYKFVIVVGGGKTARKYIQAAKDIRKLNTKDLDWIGIHSTRLNAHLLRTIFRDIAYPKIIKDPNIKVKFDKVLIAAGWKPGFSTDYDAVLLAKNLKAKTVINMTNVDYLYDKNPLTHKNAKKIVCTDWKTLRKLVGDKWVPGMNAPFDPIATKKAAKLKLRLILLGKSLVNLKKFLDKKNFKGSIIT